MNKTLGITRDTIIRIVVLYTLTILLYLNTKSNKIRFIWSLLLYVFGVILLRVNYKSAVSYFALAVCATITEHIFIKYMDSTWDYRKPDRYLVPYWLVPLWALAILIIVHSTGTGGQPLRGAALVLRI